MTKFVVYESRDEVLVTTAKNREEFEAEYFREGLVGTWIVMISPS